MPETTPGGVLIQALNGHITRGGEFEKRASFVPTYTLPDGTVGMAKTATGIYVFGSGGAPMLPSGVTYQQLVNPDNGSSALINVPSFDLYAGKIYVVGEFDDGSRHHYYDGVNVADWFDGRARASFAIMSGTASPASSVTNIQVNGVSIMSAPKAWTISNSKLAQDVADNINSTVSSPDYQAVAVDNRVVILAADAGTTPNGYNVAVSTSNGLVIDPTTGITMANGVELGDFFEPGPFVRTVSSKEYSVSGPNLHFSGVAEPTQWTTDATGAGFIDMSTYSSGSEDLKAVAPYQADLAIFSETLIQIWSVDPDPTLNTQKQILNNTGTTSPRSVTQFSDSDLFYLAESGLRSLRARDASNAASTNDIGNPVDPLITAVLGPMGDAERDRIIGLIEPKEGRFWLIMGSVIFVFSFYSGSKVSAWSMYEAGFTITDAVVFDRRVYLRSGNTIYVYGGMGDTLTYDDTVAVAQLPYLDANDPTREKTWTGFDVAAIGQWQVFSAQRPKNPAAIDAVATIVGSTFNEGRMSQLGGSTHISMIFKTKGTGEAKLGSCVIHYESSASEDKA